MLGLAWFFWATFSYSPASAQFPKPLLHAPKGSLLIVGGGDTPDAVQARFLSLAGGVGNANIAIFPMASQTSDEEAQEVLEDIARLGGVAPIVNLDPVSANSESIAKFLGRFTGYWFTGGDQMRLAKILVGTQALAAIKTRFNQGAVIGGTSAGASVMTSVMLTGRSKEAGPIEGLSTLNIAKGVQEVANGFGILRGAIVDQHFMHRARYNRLISAVLDHPDLIGVGIDEETALLVRPDEKWEVLGHYYVKVVDARQARIVGDEGPMAKASDLKIHVLPSGSVYDPKSGRASF